MKFLIVIFLAMAVVGLFGEHKGAGLLALGMAGLVVYGARQLDKRDAEWAADPRNAKLVPDTAQLLREQACECSGSRF